MERIMVFHGPSGAAGPVSQDELREIAPELFVGQKVQPERALGSYRMEAEAMHLQDVLKACGGNRELAARQLGISRTTLWRKLKRLEMLES